MCSAENAESSEKEKKGKSKVISHSSNRSYTEDTVGDCVTFDAQWIERSRGEQSDGGPAVDTQSYDE